MNPLEQMNTFFVTGRDVRGRDVFFVIQVDKKDVKTFRRVLASAIADLRLFGKILASGFGNSMPPDLNKTLRDVHRLSF